MLKRLDLMAINLKCRLSRFKDWVLYEEKGASDIVAIMVVIVILLAVAVVFREQLKKLVEKVFQKSSDWVDAQPES